MPPENLTPDGELTLGYLVCGFMSGGDESERRVTMMTKSGAGNAVREMLHAGFTYVHVDALDRLAKS